MSPRRAVRIANSSGFYGDRAAAAREMVEGGPIDVLTGDYLAELTMLILWKARLKEPDGGYARTVLRQLEPVLGTCLERGIKIVNNAGGLNPAGLAAQFATLAERLGLHPKIAYVTGDDLSDRIDELVTAGHDLANLDTGQTLRESGHSPLTANAYLGGWGITAALDAGADIVVCPRVTDAALVVGPAAWWHGWGREDFDALAGAVAAGHIIECGPQATGGNYAFLDEITDRRYPGFPIAEVEHDGSAVITKHDGTGGLVSVGTVTAQLLYEIAEPAYANPDVVAHFDTLRLEAEGENRVRVTGAVGSPPPATTKVAINFPGGFRNSVTMVVTGLDIEEKAGWFVDQLFEIVGGRDRFDDVGVQLIRFDFPDAPTNVGATAHLRVTVKSADAEVVGRSFSDAAMELVLGNYAGAAPTAPPGRENVYGVYWPALVPASEVPHAVVLPDGSTVAIPPTPTGPGRHRSVGGAGIAYGQRPRPTERVPLGRICGARSGDKGGNANVGIWARDPAGWQWLSSYLTVERFRELLPEADGLEIRRFELPNLSAVNFVIVGLLGEGVASSSRPDPQAKGLGEYLRSRVVDVPAFLLDTAALLEA